MTAVTLTLPHLSSEVAAKELSARKSYGIVVVGALLCLLQILDGVFTGIGMARFGTEAEGNALLRSLMELIGYVPALIIAKGAVVGVVIILCRLARSIKWLPWALQGVTAVYFFAAILPWTYLLML